MRAALLILLLALPCLTHAACREDARALVSAHGAPAVKTAQDAAWDALDPDNDFWTCNTLADDPDLIAIARALPSAVTEGETQAADVDFLDLEISVFNVRKNQLVARLLAPRELKEDAETLDGLRFDDARYDLDPKATVFGVRANFTARAGLVHSEHSMLALFALRKGALAQLISAMPLHSIEGHAPPEGGEPKDCAGSAGVLERTIGVAKTSSHGLRDLAVTTRTRTDRDPPNCLDDTAKPVPGPLTTKAALLRFDGCYYSLVPLKVQPPPVRKK